ncbi:FadR family transcriptional regulator [Mesobacillus maritimus]|uniref:FadR/GntR family transcriptional regulator n=1 Tax=Mesobacillus maritimus TaxID=1643336 RepID=UPI00203E873F|nr:FadR/GntR family transcriptional regulator [Mesobacillus maritimus]MCM3584790.1 FadR family transcriptional regulator [Mesobacillus maritimus]MCM3671203.1 FadR family transcriptional regulator [Mesobacillus maritimus]
MKSRSEQLVDELGRKIVTGEFVQGDILPKVEDLSEIHQVSRTVVREALKGLSTLGLVKSNQRSGTVVLPRSEWRWWNIDVLTWVLEDEKNRDFLLHLTEVRLGLEPTAVALAATRATDEDRMKIKDAFTRMEQSLGDPKAWAVADYDFHNVLLSASYNDLIINTIKTLQKALIISREKTLLAAIEDKDSPYDSPTTEALERHRAIYEAVMNRDEVLAHQKTSELILRVKRILEKIYTRDL